MVKCGDLFEVRTEFLSTLWMSFGFKGLKTFVACDTCVTQYIYINHHNRMPEYKIKLEHTCTFERVNSLKTEPEGSGLTQRPTQNQILSHHSQIQLRRSYFLKVPMHHTKNMCSMHGDNAPCILYILISPNSRNLSTYSSLLDVTNVI
jgi:hypothetical protein